MSRAYLLDVCRSPTSDYPRGLSFDRHGALLANGAADGTVTVVATDTGAIRWQARLPESVSRVAFSPLDDLLAVACFDGTTRLFDVGGVERAKLPGAKGGWVEWLAWSKSGLLATAHGRGVRVWSSQGTPVLETPPHESTVSGVAFSADGNQLLTSCYGAVRLFPLAAHAESKLLPWKSSLLSLTPSPNDKVIAVATQDNSVHFWRLDTGKDSEMSGYPARPTQLAWSSDSKLLATGGGEVICGWRFEGKGPEGTKPLMLKGHEQPISALTFSRAGLLASGGRDGDVLVWEPVKSPRPIGIAPMKDEVSELCFSPDGSLLAGADADGVSLWRVTRP